MTIEIPASLSELSADDLTSLRSEAFEAFNAVAANETPTDDDLAYGETLADGIERIDAETQERADAEGKRAERAAALRDRKFTTTVVEEETDEETDEDGDDNEDEPETETAEVEVEETEDEPEVAAAVKPKKKTVAALAKKVDRPQTPARENNVVSITAAADVPEFATGSALENMDTVGKALVNRMKGFGTPQGDGSAENFQHYGVAKFTMDFPDELTIDRNSDDMQVIAYARDESRLKDGSLVAAGGWCSPSETLYDLCVTETVDGMVSVPEVNVARGGMKFTKGPDFSTIYSSVGFQQTEAQAISGTTKASFEVTCPSFTDVRLDAIGLYIKAPILTNSAYPELVQRWLSGAMVAHQYKVNAYTLTAMDTAAGAARAVQDLTSTAQSTLSNLELVILGQRQKYRLGLSATLEVVVPYWVKGAIRQDFGLRTGRDPNVIPDSLIEAHFAAIGANVQFVYNYGELVDTDLKWPATFNALVYPAGTFVRGTSDVITLNAVYDAASLATNIYTALFFEQGILVANVCYSPVKVTIAVNNSGRTGIANISQANVLP